CKASDFHRKKGVPFNSTSVHPPTVRIAVNAHVRVEHEVGLVNVSNGRASRTDQLKLALVVRSVVPGESILWVLGQNRLRTIENVQEGLSRFACRHASHGHLFVQPAWTRTRHHPPPLHVLPFRIRVRLAVQPPIRRLEHPSRIDEGENRSRRTSKLLQSIDDLFLVCV
ncbi:hypothetical protein PMAYCL1PPCAC_32755, partial [Pristionchus mayeri]